MCLDNSLYSVTTNINECLKIVAENMIKTRPRGELCYHPYRKNEVFSDPGIWTPRMVNIKKLYPEAKAGNVVYVGVILDSVAEYDVNLNMIGNVKAFYNNVVVYDYKDNLSKDLKGSCKIHLNKGENPVLFMVRCDNDKEFEFQFMASVPPFWFWAKDYILHVRGTSPIDAFRNEDGVGISKLYETEQPFDGAYVYPSLEDETGEINFNDIFPTTEGSFAYALTTALKDCRIKLMTFSKSKIFVNGEVTNSLEFEIKKGDVLLVKSLKEDKWGFSFDKEAPIGIPFLKSNRKNGDKWLTVGTFGEKNEMDVPYGPELKIQFVNPYVTKNWKKTFWKLNNKNDYIRPYMDTCFFSQWFYALMVGHYGLLETAKVLNNSEYIEYFVDSMQNMAKFYNYMFYESENFGEPTFIQKGTELNNLDAIGTMGMNMCELYKLTSSPESLYCIEYLASAMKENIPKFDDGTFCRERDMWSDDTFMSCPFLIRIALVKNDAKYFQEVVRQLLGFKKRLWMQDKKVFSHIYFLESKKPNRVPWGRGNGWVFVTLSDVLEKLPENIEGYDELLQLFVEFAEGIIENQDSEGLWHQVLTRPDAYQETSCTGMFIIGLCRGIRNGWLTEKYKENVRNAFIGLIRHKIDKTGNIYDVCRGSSNSMDEEYYMKLGVIDNDDHGTGIILMALSEMIKLLS